MISPLRFLAYAVISLFLLVVLVGCVAPDVDKIRATAETEATLTAEAETGDTSSPEEEEPVVPTLTDTLREVAAPNGTADACRPDEMAEVGQEWSCERDGAVYVYVPGTDNVDGFWMKQTEVTNVEYERCINDNSCVAPQCDQRYPLFKECRQYHWVKTSSGDYKVQPGYEKHPVNFVTGRNAKDYFNWVGGRFPTKDEWELACRGPDGYDYPWGNSDPQPGFANYAVNYGQTQSPDTTEVKSFEKDKSGYDIYDMGGNLREWLDSGDVAGGSFDSEYSGALRCETVAGQDHSNKHQGFGIRVVIPK